MDRKNFFLGMACIVGAFALFFLTKPAPKAPAAPTPVVQAAAPVPPALKPAPSAALAPAAGKPVARADAKSFVIENDHIKVTLSSRGGAVSKVELKKEFADVYKAGIVSFNAGHEESALALAV